MTGKTLDITKGIGFKKEYLEEGKVYLYRHHN